MNSAQGRAVPDTPRGDRVAALPLRPAARSAIRRLRVLLVSNFLSESRGTRAASEDLAARLSAAGHTVITTSSRVSRLPRLLDMVATAIRRRAHYDVVHVDVFSGMAFCTAEIVCAVVRLLRKPYVLTLHGGNLPEYARRWPGRVRHLLRHADGVTAPSLYLVRRMKPYREEIDCLPNAIDAGEHAFRLREHPRPRLLWLRGFHHLYNPALTPAVVARLTGEFPTCQLTMVGPDSGDGSLEDTVQAAAALGVAERITVAGRVPKSEVPRRMAEADIFLNTTFVDNAPVSVLEAMAAGLCIVSTCVGGIADLLEGERDALLVPPGDDAAMAAAVRRVLREPGLAARLSRNARAKAERFDWAQILPEWETYFTTLAHGCLR